MTINVFISSTSRDLTVYRDAAIEVCNRLKLVPIAMEFFEAMSAGATSGSKQKLEESNLYVGIFAHRYGYIEDGYNKAVTEIEFDHAGKLNLDRLCFLVDPTYPWPPDAIDYKNNEQLQRFKSSIDKSLIRSQFTDVNDFKAKLLQSLVEWLERNRPNEKEHLVITKIETSLVATAPPFPSLLIGREDDYAIMKQRMGIFDSDRKVSTTIVHGWPGVGKTTLITALAYDKDINAAFPDGILWATVGENPSPFQELIGWGQALGVEMSHVRTLDEAMIQVRALLRDKKALLIVDDIWDKDEASPFRVGGSACVTVITTRFLDIARELSATPEEIFLLGTLSNERGFELLQRLAPTVTAQHPDASRELVSDLEGLPLALRVAGRLLEAEAQDGFDVPSLRCSSHQYSHCVPDDGGHRIDPPHLH